MLYLNDSDIKSLGVDWQDTINVIEQAVHCLKQGDYAQPIKPYLRYGNPKNRIIAMPAYLGEGFSTAGIKWIASFPDNIQQGIPRAHSVVILNEASTGRPLAIINTPLLSVIRTASVSGLILRIFCKAKRKTSYNVGITGFGPIGQHHSKMCHELLGTGLQNLLVYDVRSGPDVNVGKENTLARDWRDAYKNADVFITCTVSNSRYIDYQPLPGSLHLNVSLRDYTSEMYKYFEGAIAVDDWDEVCRQSTDIEIFHKDHGLCQKEVGTIVDIVEQNWISSVPVEKPIMFNPMGMAVFDIAIAKYYFDKAERNGVGTSL